MTEPVTTLTHRSLRGHLTKAACVPIRITSTMTETTNAFRKMSVDVIIMDAIILWVATCTCIVIPQVTFKCTKGDRFIIMPHVLCQRKMSIDQTIQCLLSPWKHFDYRMREVDARTVRYIFIILFYDLWRNSEYDLFVKNWSELLYFYIKI